MIVLIFFGDLWLVICFLYFLVLFLEFDFFFFLMWVLSLDGLIICLLLVFNNLNLFFLLFKFCLLEYCLIILIDDDVKYFGFRVFLVLEIFCWLYIFFSVVDWLYMGDKFFLDMKFFFILIVFNLICILVILEVVLV